MLDERAERAVAVAGSRFAAVNIIAKRARDLTDGAPPRARTGLLAATTALEELAAGQIDFR